MRQKVADEEARQKADRDAMDTDASPHKAASPSPAKDAGSTEKPHDAAMDVDNRHQATPPEPEKKDEPASMQADDEEAVEY